MKATIEVVKDRIEEAAGLVTGNEKMRARGQKGQTEGYVEQGPGKGARGANGRSWKATVAAKIQGETPYHVCMDVC